LLIATLHRSVNEIGDRCAQTAPSDSEVTSSSTRS
jgi:hypothetical protein